MSTPALRYAARVVVHDAMPRSVIDTYVRRHVRASGYHQPAWLEIIARAFGHQTRCFAAEGPRGLVGILPLVTFRSRLFGRFAVSVPFVNYGGVLADSAEAEQALLDAAIREAVRAGSSHLELRHERRIFPGLAAKHHKVAMRLALASTSERQWQILDRKVRNQVRKAEKSGLNVRVGGGELIEEFYQVFARNMRDLGTPVYGLSFFREVLSTFPDAARIFVIAKDGRPVACSLTYGHHDTLEVPWASAIREFNSLCANVLLYWEMLRFAVEQGFRTFDFGRSTPDEGTYHFKRQWGAEPTPLVWEYWTAPGRSVPNLSPANPKFGAAIAAWRRLPVKVASAVGPLIVRNLP